MFRKLISNLPFNPSLVGQVSFYAKRVNEEATVRRAGFALIALAMFIQMFAIIAPPEKSLAASDNHIINGLRTRDDILAAWNRAGSDIPAIYGKFGLTKADIEKLPMNPNTSLKSDSGPDYWTIGRNSLSNYANVNYLYKLSEVALNTGPTTVYMRQLRAWDIQNPYNLYQAFTGVKADGTRFWILLDCGNYVQVGKYAPKTPTLDLRKTIVGATTKFKPGDTFTFRFEYRDTVQDSLAENVILHDDFDTAHYTMVTSLPGLNGGSLSYPVGSLSYTPNYNVLNISVRLKNPFPGDNGKTCNAAKLTSANAVEAWGGPACATVTTPCAYNPALVVGDPACKPPVDKCQYNPNIPKTDPACKPPVDPCKYDPSKPANDPTCKEPSVLCSLVDTDLDKITRVASFKTTVSTTNESATKIKSYTYDFGDNKTETFASTALIHTTKHTYAAGAFTAKVTAAYTVNGDTTNTVKKVECSAHIEFENDKPFGEMKKVKNITQNLEGEKALAAKLQAGDVLEYSLITSNTQDYARKNYVVVDYVGDILDYADVDTAHLATTGGTYDATTKKISFKHASIAAKTDVTDVFRVKLKNPLPATNSPSAVSGSFDCRISNKYGNELNMIVACPTVKGLETIPNTGPGTSMMLGFAIVTIVGYFFARARIMAKELAIIKSEYLPSGGY